MKQRFRLFIRGTVYWCHDGETNKQESLRTKDRTTALELLHAKNQPHVQAQVNLQIARAYLMASDPENATRTWQKIMDEIAATKTGDSQVRWHRGMKQSAFDPIRNVNIVETRPDQIFLVLRAGTVSTNAYLRQLQNYALEMGWLPCPVVPKKQWPKPQHKEKRAITKEEHERIIGIEWNPERKAFYQLLWHFGGSQSDVASLCAEDIRWSERVISYTRKKTKQTALIHFSEPVAAILKSLPKSGPLFPRILKMSAKHRACEFIRRCRRLRIEGISLHSYRYAWAERALACGYPERFAMAALGHSSRAVHRLYSKKAQVTIPALEEYENKASGTQAAA